MTDQPSGVKLPTDAQVKAGAARRAAQRARRYGEEAVAGDVTLVDEEEAREIYLAMQAKAPATSVGGVGAEEIAKIISRHSGAGHEHFAGRWMPAANAILAALAQPTVAVGGLREALTKCRDKFAEYVELHKAKLHDDTPTMEWLSANDKVARNKEMVRLCDQALSIREDDLDSGADRALVASDQARSGLGPSGFDHG